MTCGAGSYGMVDPPLTMWYASFGCVRCAAPLHQYSPVCWYCSPHSDQDMYNSDAVA